MFNKKKKHELEFLIQTLKDISSKLDALTKLIQDEKSKL